MNPSSRAVSIQMRLNEIGRIRSPYTQATGTPIQPCRAVGSPGYATLQPEFIPGLEDLADLLVRPRRRPAPACVALSGHRGARPLCHARAGAAQMSGERLLGIEGAILRLAEVDILDGTPLLDIKPYVPRCDNYPIQRFGWLDQVPNRPVVADDRFERKLATASKPFFQTLSE